MKTLILKTALIFAISFFCTSNIYSADEEASKKIHQEYDVDNETVLNIINKYGFINISNHAKNKVVIDVKVTVKDKNKVNAKEKLDYITIDLNFDDNIIKAVTNIDDKINGTGLFKNKSKTKYSIDYTIKMPVNLKLDLNNKYGNIYIKEIQGKSNINLKYGTLKADNMLFPNTKPLSRIYIKYGKGFIGECNWASVVFKYSEMTIDKGTALVFITKYSELKLGTCSSVIAESGYDVYNIGTVKNFVLKEGKYSDYKIGQVNNKIDIETKYGNFKVDKVAKGFSVINVDSKYTDINLGIDKNASYKIDAEVDYGDIDLPKRANVDKHHSYTSTEIDGVVGSNQNPKSVVNIELQYGSVDLDD